MQHLASVPDRSAESASAVTGAAAGPRSVGWLPQSVFASAVAAGVLYFAFALVAVLLSRRYGSVGLLWYANAVAMAVLVSKPGRQWSILLGAMAIGALAAGLAIGDPVRLTLSCMAANALEILLGSVLLRRYCAPADCISRLGVLLRALLLGGVLPAALGAVVGAGLLSAGGLGSFDTLWLTWFEGSSIGSVAVLPLGLLLVARGWRAVGLEWRRPSVLAAMALVMRDVAVRAIVVAAPVHLHHDRAVPGRLDGHFAGASLGALVCSLSVAVLIASGSFQPLMSHPAGDPGPVLSAADAGAGAAAAARGDFRTHPVTA